MSAVGRTPRDLFADRRVRLVTNLVEEWIWIGTVVAVAGLAMIFFEATDQFADYVFWGGLVMIGIRLLVKPLALGHAELSPEYEARVRARVS